MTGGGKGTGGGAGAGGGNKGEKPAPPPNLVLPSFEDTFARLPRSLPPKQTGLKKALEVMGSYFFSVPPSPNASLPTGSSTATGTGSTRGKGKGKAKVREWDEYDEMAMRLPKYVGLVGESLERKLDGVRKVAVIGVHG